MLDSAFDAAQAVVVLMTPDEIAYLRDEYSSDESDPEREPGAQARPNVLFEAGMAMGRHPKRTVLAELGAMRPFSDIAGRHILRITDEPERRKELAQRHKHDPLYRARKLLVSASENITDNGHTKLRGLLDAGDPYGEVRDAWHAKETLRSIYDIDDANLGAATVNQLAQDLQDPAMPPEVNRLGRTIWNWRHQISNWHAARVTNAPTEAANNLVKRVKRAAFGFTNFTNYRIRALLYAGKPNWALLDTLTPT